MFRQLTFIIPLLLCTTVVAQKIGGYFVSKSDESGTVYFLESQKIFAASTGDQLEYDLTTRDDSDSISMNFTYRTDSATPIDSIRIESPSVTFGGKVNKLFIEPERKVWAHRYIYTGLRSDIISLYKDSDSTPSITLYSGDDILRYDAIQSKWRRYTPIGSRIFEMIDVNLH